MSELYTAGARAPACLSGFRRPSSAIVCNSISFLCWLESSEQDRNRSTRSIDLVIYVPDCGRCVGLVVVLAAAARVLLLSKSPTWPLCNFLVLRFAVPMELELQLLSIENSLGLLQDNTEILNSLNNTDLSLILEKIRSAATELERSVDLVVAAKNRLDFAVRSLNSRPLYSDAFGGRNCRVGFLRTVHLSIADGSLFSQMRLFFMCFHSSQ